MKPLAQIMMESVGEAARTGRDETGRHEAVIGYFIAAQRAGAERTAHWSLILETLKARTPPPLEVDPAGHLANLTIRAITSRSLVHVKELVDALANQPPELMIAATNAVFDFHDDDKGVARLMIERARSLAQHLITGESAKTALVRATEEVLPRLDALAEANPHDLQILSTHHQLNLDAERYVAAIEDLRQLMKGHADNPFVYINLSALLRTVDHPEVKASLTHLVANIGDSRSELESWFFSLLSCEAIPEAFQVLDRLIVHAPEFQMIRDLRDMADDLDQEPAHTFGVTPSGRHLIYASMICWGGKYLDLMEEVAIASLLSQQNFPALCANNDVVIDFVTMPGDAAKIMAMPGVQALAKLCEIRIYLFPPITDLCRPHIGRLSYSFLGSGSALTMKRAERDGADLIFLIPDVVYADGSFAHIASLVTKQPCALMADGLNTFAQPMLKALEPYRDRAAGSLTVSIPDLIDHASQNFMPRTTDYYFDPGKPDVISYPQRLVFREQDGLVVHAFSKLAVYVSHAGYAPLGQVNYGTPDSFLTNHLMKNLPKQFLHPTDGDLKFLMMELAEDAGRLWPRTTEPVIDAIEGMYRHYGFHINCFNMFEIGDRYPVRVRYSDRLTTAAQREEFLASLREARRTRTVFTELCMERAKYDRAVQGPT